MEVRKILVLASLAGVFFLGADLRGEETVRLAVVVAPSAISGKKGGASVAVKNVSAETIELAALRVMQSKAAPYGPTDTYWSASMKGGEGRLTPLFYGEAKKEGGVAFVAGNGAIKEAVTKGAWRAEDVCRLAPGEAVGLEVGRIAPWAHEVDFYFLRRVDGGFKPVRVRWVRAEGE